MVLKKTCLYTAEYEAAPKANRVWLVLVKLGLCVCAPSSHQDHCSPNSRTGFSAAMQCTVSVRAGEGKGHPKFMHLNIQQALIKSSPPADAHLGLPFSLHSIHSLLGSSLVCALPLTATLHSCSRTDLSARRAPASYCCRGYWSIPGHQCVRFPDTLTSDIKTAECPGNASIN